ncbi:type II toxin-antitoxin system HipA family toxin [Specibacter cremeus]|uniref:type II toxin-antitoxin system HipA family toxin n=1 Tax=Specibacter cremeus TaxID=1629051 RepID=UPI000F76F1FE|nr:HipA domain-containing protein [Specibacter cremeus]
MNPEDAKRVPRAIVYKNGVPAATIERNAHAGVVFAYLPDYVTDGRAAVASTLPVLNVPVTLGHGVVPAYFAGLLPEGPQLAKLRWTVKTTLADELSLLIAAGADPVGNVQIVPAGELPPAPGETPPAAALPERIEEVRFADLVSDAAPLDRRAVPGVQPKVSATWAGNAPARPGRALPPRDYILKLNPADRPYLVEDEHRLAALAADLGIRTAGPLLVRDGAGAPGLLVPRFDRAAGVRLAVEDGAQLLGITPAKKRSVPAEGVAMAAIRMCAAGKLAGRALLLQFLFAWLTGNGNLHAKNVSVVQHESGEWFLAPAYDLQCTLAQDVEEGLAAGIPGGIPTDLPDDHRSQDPGMALTLGRKSTALTGTDWLRFARTLNLPDRLAHSCMARVLEATAVTPADLPYEREVSAGVVRVLNARRAAMAR